MVGSVPPLIAAGVAALKLLEDRATVWLGWVSVGAAAWLSIAACVKIAAANVQDRKESADQGHDGLRAALHVLHASIGQTCGLAADVARKNLRVTFHRVIEPLDHPTQFEQLTDYVGGAGGGKNRRFPIQSGIAGRAVRMKSVYAQSRMNDDHVAYERELVEVWGFTEQDARERSRHCFSWMAIPISDVSGASVLGVVYVDGVDKDLFGDAGRREAIVVACSGIATYVRERYK